VLVGVGLGLVEVGLGLGEVVVGVGVGVAGGVVDAVTVGVGVALGVVLAVALAGALTVGVAVGVGVAELTARAVSLAAHGFVAAEAGPAVPISKAPVRLAAITTRQDTMPNAWAMARRMLMDNALATVVIPVRVALAAMMSLSTRVAFPASLIRHLVG
jgi:hypothetical protein